MLRESTQLMTTVITRADTPGDVIDISENIHSIQLYSYHTLQGLNN